MYRLRLKEVLERLEKEGRKISQGRLSRGANVPPHLISRMINDPTYEPQYPTLKRVADFLHVTMDELVEEIPDPPDHSFS